MSVSLAPLAPALAQLTTISRSEYEACHTQNEAQFRKAIEQITYEALHRGTKQIDYLAIIGDEWRRQKFDALIDTRVDLATAKVRQQTSWSQLLKSLAYREKAKELASAIAERVYRSDAIKAGLDKLARGVGRQIGRSIELTTHDAAQPAQKCLQAFLGPRYGDAVTRVVTRDAGAAFKVDANNNQASVSTGAVILNASGGLAGAVVLVVRRQLANMAQRLGQRLVGSVLSRLVSVVATGVGIVLIAKDAWDFRHGVLPIIATEMKAPATKASVRRELASAIQQQMQQQIRLLASQTADQILDIWKSFRRSHAKVLEMADSNQSFRKFLDAAKPEQLPALDEIIGLTLQDEGEAGIQKRLADGTLHRALNRMSPAGLQIARELKSIDRALEWTALAGDHIKAVHTYELHRRAMPNQFTQTSLTRLFALGEPTAILRLAKIGKVARDTLFTLPDKDLLNLSQHLSADELNTLSRYLQGLARPARARVLNVVAKAPARMRVLASGRVRNAILASKNQLAAVEMMLRADQKISLDKIYSDARLVLNGDVNPILLWDKHPGALVLVALALLIFLLLLQRIFSRSPSRRIGSQAITNSQKNEPHNKPTEDPT